MSVLHHAWAWNRAETVSTTIAGAVEVRGEKEIRMAEDKREADRLGGEYMIQDRDHSVDAGQMGGETSHRRGQQSEQSQGASRQQGGGQHSGGGQQGGERNRKSQ